MFFRLLICVFDKIIIVYYEFVSFCHVDGSRHLYVRGDYREMTRERLRSSYSVNQNNSDAI